MAYSVPELLLVGAAQNLVLGVCDNLDSIDPPTCEVEDNDTSKDSELW